MAGRQLLSEYRIWCLTGAVSTDRRWLGNDRASRQNQGYQSIMERTTIWSSDAPSRIVTSVAIGKNDPNRSVVTRAQKRTYKSENIESFRPGQGFELKRHHKELHITPDGTEKMYLYCHFRRTAQQRVAAGGEHSHQRRLVPNSDGNADR